MESSEGEKVQHLNGVLKRQNVCNAAHSHPNLGNRYITDIYAFT